MMLTTDQTIEEQSQAQRTGPPPASIPAGSSVATDLEQQARTLIRQHPLVAVLAATGVGFLIARVFVRGIR